MGAMDEAPAELHMLVSREQDVEVNARAAKSRSSRAGIILNKDRLYLLKSLPSGRKLPK